MCDSEYRMAPVIYEVNNQPNDKSIEIKEIDDSKYTKTYTLDEAIEETSMYHIVMGWQIV